MGNGNHNGDDGDDDCDINSEGDVKRVTGHLATKQTRHQRTGHQGTISPPTYSPPSEVFSPPTTNKEIN